MWPTALCAHSFCDGYTHPFKQGEALVLLSFKHLRELFDFPSTVRSRDKYKLECEMQATGTFCFSEVASLISIHHPTFSKKSSCSVEHELGFPVTPSLLQCFQTYLSYRVANFQAPGDHPLLQLILSQLISSISSPKENGCFTGWTV